MKVTARGSALLAGLVAFAATAALAAPAGRSRPPTVTKLSRRATISVAEIKPGMEGYGLTVFQGTKPERFHVKIIGVLKKFLPQQDVILFRSNDPRLKHTGIVKGMSGSPVYLSGRLVGAVAYGWPYSKEPIGGITPIENMLRVAERPRRGRELAVLSQEARAQEEQLLMAGLGLKPPAPAPAPSAEAQATALRRVAVPVSLAGFSEPAVAALRESLRPFGLEPLQAGGGGSEPGASTTFEPGSAIGVTLIRGDMSAVGTGTVTHVEGKTVLGFGHRMFGVGELYLPVSTARIHTFLPSRFASFKMSSPMAEAGTLVMDRQAGIVAQQGERVDMIPIDVKVGGTAVPTTALKAEVVRHRLLTPLLASAVVLNAARKMAPDATHAVIGVHSTVVVRGHQPLTFHDRVFSQSGLSPRVLALSGGFKALRQLLFNPFETATLDRLSFKVDISYRPDVAEMVGISVDAVEVDPGSRVNLYVTLRPYGGAEYVETIPFRVPEEYAGENLSLDITPGPLAPHPQARPESLDDLIENLRDAKPPGDTFVVTVVRQTDGVAYRGRLLPELPPSAIDTLRQATQLRRVDKFRAVTQLVRHAGRVVVGRQRISLRVKDRP